MASDDKNSYRGITKAMSLFGGVTVFQIIVNLIKNKFIAVLLGPFGMGISGIITSTISMVSSLTGLGLQTASVRDVSKAYKNGNQNDLAETVTILRKLVWFTGFLGLLIVACFASYFSQLAFGNEEYALYFRFVSIVLLLDQLCVGQTVLLKGTFHYRYMAKASLLGSIVGLFFTIPLYYIGGVNAIVPVIVITSIIHLVFSSFYSRKVIFQKAALSIRDIFVKGRTMIVMGLALAMSSVVSASSVYIQRVILSNIGSIEDVGLYTAGIGIATQYINIIFTSISSDYSPRLASVSGDNDEFIKTINRQMKLLITVIAPMIILFIVLIREITILLYSDKFLPISGMLEWVMFGMFFRATSWSISYALIARGDAKPFFFCEVLGTTCSVIMSILGYYLYSFEGMGVGFCVSYIIYTLVLYFVGRKQFSLSIKKDVLSSSSIQILTVFLFTIVLKILGYTIWRYLFGFISIAIIAIVAYKFLDEMIDLKSILVSLKKKCIK